MAWLWWVGCACALGGEDKEAVALVSGLAGADKKVFPSDVANPIMKHFREYHGSGPQSAFAEATPNAWKCSCI